VKKWVIILSLIILATVTYNIFSAESELYARTVFIHRIFNHPTGFIVHYQKQNMRLHEIYIPYSWFQVPREGGVTAWRAEVIYGNRPEFPFMQIFWDRNGFSHVRLFLHENRTHPSWGTLRNPSRFNDSFDIEEPYFRF